MKTALWLLLSPLVLVVLAAFAGCGDNPLYACPDPSMPCFGTDAGPDAAADAATD